MTEQQELDKILGRWIKGYINGSASKFYVTNQTKQEILDWHNKQVEELLDRLEARKEQTIYADFESGSVEGWTGVPVTTIEAERNKLKERDERK